MWVERRIGYEIVLEVFISLVLQWMAQFLNYLVLPFSDKILCLYISEITKIQMLIKQKVYIFSCFILAGILAKQIKLKA